MSLRNYYYILGIQPNATEDELRQAYKSMALKWHPDRHLDDAEKATRRFLEVQEAYRALIRERHQYLDSSFASRVAQRSDSRQTESSFSDSTPSLASFIRVSTSSTDSLVTTPSTVKSGQSHTTCHSPCCKPVSPTFVAHHSTYANDDLSHSHRPHKKPYGSYHSRHSSGDIRSPNSEWTNYTPPTLHKYTMPRQRREPQSFTIIPPLRKSRLATPAATSWDYYNIRDRQQVIPLRSVGIGPSKEWIYTLSLTLEELLKGKQCCFSFSRKLRSGVTKSVMLSVEIPPGCREGTRILCRAVGDERKDGTRQDIAFIIEELQHEHFSRLCDDLVLDVRIPWSESLKHQGGGFFVGGIDKQKYWFNVDYPRERVLKGKHIIKGGGMPIRRAGQIVGRGCLVIQWEIIVAEHPKMFSFMKRFMNFRK